MKIILIGYRATGKSTVGKLLADQMKMPFRDTDTLIEESEGKTIKEIVAGHGWDYFREREKEIIQKLAKKDKCVIATGGGVVLQKENVDLLKQMGKIIWLNAPLHDIIERLKADAKNGEKRPRFTKSNIVQETATMLKERLPLYKKNADFTVTTDDKSVAKVAEEISAFLKKKETAVKKSASMYKRHH
jgi:shikimate kinase